MGDVSPGSAGLARSARSAVSSPVDTTGSLPLDVAAGQTLLLAFEGRVAPPSILEAIRAAETPGAALYRALNVESPAQVRALTSSLQTACP